MFLVALRRLAQRSRHSDSLRVGRSGVRSALLARYVAPIQTDRGAQHSLPVQWTAGVKRQGLGIGHSYPCSPEVKHGWSYTAMPPSLPPCYMVDFVIVCQTSVCVSHGNIVIFSPTQEGKTLPWMVCEGRHNFSSVGLLLQYTLEGNYKYLKKGTWIQRTRFIRGKWMCPATGRVGPKGSG